MKRMAMMVAAVVIWSVTGGVAGDNAGGGEPGKAGKGPRSLTLQELRLTGTVKKTQTRKPDGTLVVTVFTLVTADGVEVALPAPGKGAGAAPAVNLDDFVGSAVVVTGTGMERTDPQGRKQYMLRTLREVRKAAADPGAAPATP